MKNQENIDLLVILDKLNKIGAALSSEVNIDRLLEMILESICEIVQADGGTFYTVSSEDTLVFSAIQNSSLNIKMGGTSSNPIFVPALPLYIDFKPNENIIACFCALNKKTVNIEDAYKVDGFDFSGVKAFDTKMGYITKSVLAIPLINFDGKVIGVLQLINRKNDQGNLVPFNDFSVKLAESVASQAAISLHNRTLINQFEKLFEEITNLINTAIDEKSPYTGGHCMRVPELTLMIAEVANKEMEGPLAAFTMTEKDRYELRVASMLHDCGKITTPVHVVDKATKLETIMDRIHLVELKAEIIRKEIQIQSNHALIARPHDKVNIEKNLAQALESIHDDIAFIKKCNIGGERMSPEDIERIKTISKRTWTNYENDIQPFLTEDEVYNLSIVAGTLNMEERKIINNHINTTIKLLEHINWPDHLKNVPEYAGGHHEKMDGTGYPRGLKRSEMSLQARMMGIADIFEALTASDRPYKKAMPLSQAIKIMQRMKDEAHIDPDIFDAFINNGVHIEYAKRYLNPEQIDLQQPK